jgi:hypothetical protein
MSYCDKHGAYTDPDYEFPCHEPKIPKIGRCLDGFCDLKPYTFMVTSSMCGQRYRVTCNCGITGPRRKSEAAAIEAYNEILNGASDAD